MSHVWNAAEPIGGELLARRRAHIRAEWSNVRVEAVDDSGAASPRADGSRAPFMRAWVRLGRLVPAEVVVELVGPSPSGGRQMWCEQSYHNGSFAYTAGPLCADSDAAADAAGDAAGDEPDRWAVRVMPASEWAGPVDLPPVVGLPAERHRGHHRSVRPTPPTRQPERGRPSSPSPSGP